MVLGFDPLYQFMHEDDAADAICVALEKSLRGVYNVAGPQPMPLSLLDPRRRGRTPVPVPEICCSSSRSAASACRRCRRARSRTSSIRS